MIGESKTGQETPEWYFPNVPQPSDDDWLRLSRASNFNPLFFDWFQWTGIISTTIAFIQPDSQDFDGLSDRDYALLSSMLVRCSRLVKSIMALTHEGENGETASIIQRSLEETAIKIMWLCKRDTSERVRRYISDGLKVELEFEKIIRKTVAENEGLETELEERMLRSIQNHIDAASISREEIGKSKKMPDMAAIHQDVSSDPKGSRLGYVVQQRLGSHAVHGNWPSLRRDYLTKSEIEGYSLQPNAEPVEFHVNQFMSGARYVILAAKAYVGFCLVDKSLNSFNNMLLAAEEELLVQYDKAIKFGL